MELATIGICRGITTPSIMPTTPEGIADMAEAFVAYQDAHARMPIEISRDSVISLMVKSSGFSSYSEARA